VLRGSQPIAEAANRLDEFRALEFSAQSRDVNVQRLLRPRPRPSPYLSNDSFPHAHRAIFHRDQREDLKFLSRQADRDASDRHGLALLLGAGIAAGLSGSIAGLASLFSYPALLVAGLPATVANVTNTVSIAVSCLGSLASSGPELTGQATVVRRLGVFSTLGGATGAGLLLVTPSGVFERIVPFLVGAGSIVLLVYHRSARDCPSPHPAAGPGESRRLPLLAGVLAVSVYGGYFGAAAGVLMLALLRVALPDALLRANALKNMLLGLASMTAGTPGEPAT